MAYFWLKTFHIVGVVAWMAGLFYLPRLFVYHAEALAKPEPERSALAAQFTIMERRLYRGITTPAMVFSVAMGAALVWTEPGVLRMPWMQGKIGLVLLLIVFHLFCGEVASQFAAGETPFGARIFRVINEVPTLLLVGIVGLVVFKDLMPGGAFAAVMATLALLLGLGMLLYARVRDAKKPS